MLKKGSGLNLYKDDKAKDKLPEPKPVEKPVKKGTEKADKPKASK